MSDKPTVIMVEIEAFKQTMAKQKERIKQLEEENQRLEKNRKYLEEQVGLLLAERYRLLEALKPFAEHGHPTFWPDDENYKVSTVIYLAGEHTIIVADLRRARAASEKSQALQASIDVETPSGDRSTRRMVSCSPREEEFDARISILEDTQGCHKEDELQDMRHCLQITETNVEYLLRRMGEIEGDFEQLLEKDGEP